MPGFTSVMEALDELASALRGRLIERARSGEAAEGALEDEVRTLVEAEAAPLPEDEHPMWFTTWWKPEGAS